MNILFVLVVSSLFFYITPTHAGKVASVIKLRGRVTQLAGGEISARSLKEGDFLVDDTSIVTLNKSFVQLKFNDGSTVNLGPNSKIRVSSLKKSAERKGIVSLLKGKIRTKVIRDKEKENNPKFFIRTRSAAMAVRGTDFLTTYNPENNVTALLTYKGEVEIVQKKIIISKKTSFERREYGDIEVESVDVIEEENLEQIFMSKDVVPVKAGQFSGTVGNLERPSSAVRISPHQLKILYHNEFLIDTSDKEGKKDISDKLSDFKTPKEDQEVPLEGAFDKEKNLYAPKAGGFLDLATGYYIPPGKDSYFDEKYNVYKTKNIGFIDRKTGNYIPPKGLILNAKDGFKLSKNTQDNKKLMANAQELNGNMKKDMILPKEEKLVEDQQLILSKTELMTRDYLELNLQTFSNRLSIRSDSVFGAKDIDQNGVGFNLSWSHATTSRFQLITGFGFKSISFDSINISQDADTLLNILLGLRYNLSSRWNLITSVEVDQDLVLFSAKDAKSGVNSQQISRLFTTKLYLGIEGNILKAKGGKFSLDTSFGGFLSPSKTDSLLELSSSLGLTGNLMAYYWPSTNFQIGLGPWFESYQKDVTGTTILGREFHSESIGFSLNIGKVF